MLNSKKLICTTLSLCLLIASVSCVRSARKPESSTKGTQKASDFRATEVTGASISESKSQNWSVPTEKEYEFSVCLIGRNTTAQLPAGQKFRVHLYDNEIKNVETDDLGCIEWMEKIPFNFSGDSGYIGLNRKVSGVGTYQGSLDLKVGVNPWSEYRNEGTKEVIDLNRNKIASNFMLPEVATKGAMIGLFSENSGRDLMIDSQVPITITSKERVPEGRIVKINLQVTPFILPLDINSDPKRYNFKNGEFRIHAAIMADSVGEKNKKRMLLTSKLLPSDIKITNGGTIGFSAETLLDRRVNNGQLKLALRIEPLGSAPFKMNAYEGLHDIGTFDQLLGSKSAPQTTGSYSNELFDYDSFVKKADNFEDLVKEGFAQKLPSVYFSYLEPRFVRFEPGETVTRRKLKYQVSTRVTDSITGKPIQFQPFHIKRAFDGTVITDQKTNEEGIIRWMDDIEHLYYKPEQYFYPATEITHVESGMVEKRTLAINPWDEGWTFGVDITGQEAEHKKVNQREGRPPLFVIDAFRYQTIRFQYAIDEFMTLTVKKAVVMTFDPIVQRFGIKGDRYFEPLRDGIYLLKLALVKYYIDPFQMGTHLYNENHTEDPDDVEDDPNYVLKRVGNNGDKYQKGQYFSVIKKLVRVQGGRITTPMEFSMRDLRMMSIRTNLIAQIETIDEEKLLRDNIIDDKIMQLKKDYIAYNSEDLSDEEKKQFIKEKEAAFKKEALLLKETMQKEIQAVHRQRDFVSDQYFKRFEILSELENNLGSSVAAGTARYQDNLDLPEKEFNNYVERLHKNTDSLELNMEKYWNEWEVAYKKSLIEGTSETGLPAIPKQNIDAKKSYYDYLATMNTFLTGFGIGTIGQSDLNRMKVNNYTENPAVPFLDLNLYRNDAGLATRAFIAPCTLVEDDNMSDMRATDVLDEDRSGRIDSSEILYKPRYVIDNSAFEDSAYHDSLKPFKDKLVDDYIDEYIANEDRYVKEMDAVSQLGNFTKLYNLDYLSLKDNTLKEYETGCEFPDGKICLKDRHEDQIKKSDFLTSFNDIDMKYLLKRYFYNNPELDLKKLDEKLQGSDFKVKPIWEVAYEKTTDFFDFLNVKGAWKDVIYTSYANSSKKYIEEKLENSLVETSEANLHKWLKSGVKDLDLSSAVKFCEYLSKKTVENLTKKGLIDPEQDSGFLYSATPSEYLLDHCLKGIKYIPSTGKVYLTNLTFDRRYRVITPGAYKHVTGKNMNINVGADTVISKYEDTGSAVSIGSNAAFLGLAAAGIAKSHPIAAGGVAAIGGFMALSKSATKAAGVNLATASAISAATFLVVQKAEMDFTIEAHEKCLISQFNSKFMSTINWRYMGLKEGVLTNNKKLNSTIGRGIMICDGEVHTTPEKVTENYYYFTQHFTAGDMLDKANLQNHVWLLALRGTPDYNNFIRILQAQKVNKNNEVVGKTEDLYEYPLSHLDQVYQNVTPSFPGMYSVPD